MVYDRTRDAMIANNAVLEGDTLKQWTQQRQLFDEVVGSFQAAHIGRAAEVTFRPAYAPDAAWAGRHWSEGGRSMNRIDVNLLSAKQLFRKEVVLESRLDASLGSSLGPTRGPNRGTDDEREDRMRMRILLCHELAHAGRDRDHPHSRHDLPFSQLFEELLFTAMVVMDNGGGGGGEGGGGA